MNEHEEIARLSVRPRSAWIPVVVGLGFLVICLGVAVFFPPSYAAGIVGLLVSAGACFVMLVAMPRAAQLSLFGAAVGVTADGAYANFTDQTPVTLANALVHLATSLVKAVGIVAENALPGTGALTAIPIGVWTFILGSIAIMGASFLIKHDD